MPRTFDVDNMTPKERAFMVAGQFEDGWSHKVIDTSTLESLVMSRGERFKRSLKQPSTGCGLFDRISNEVVVMILTECDVAALLRLRTTNHYIKAFIDSWLPFRDLCENAQVLMGVTLKTGVANKWTAPQIQQVIYTDRCELCGEVGAFLQLLTLTRCCFRCLSNDRRLLSVTVRFAQAPYGMNVHPRDLGNNCLFFSTLRRQEFWGEDSPRGDRQIMLVDYATALEYSPTMTNSFTWRFNKIIQKRLKAGKAKKSYYCLPALNGNANIVPPETEVDRFQTAMFLPALERSRDGKPPRPQTTLSCRGCRYYWNLKDPYHHYLEQPMFTEATIMSHLRSCNYTRLWWNKLYPYVPITTNSSSTASQYALQLAARVDVREAQDPVRTIQILSGLPKIRVFPREDLEFKTGNFDSVPGSLMLAYFISQIDVVVPYTHFGIESDTDVESESGEAFADDHDEPTDPHYDPYADSLIGLDSQANWATAHASRGLALAKFFPLSIERRRRYAGKNGLDAYTDKWKAALKVQYLPLERPHRPRVLCYMGLPVLKVPETTPTTIHDMTTVRVVLKGRADRPNSSTRLMLDYI